MAYTEERATTAARMLRESRILRANVTVSTSGDRETTARADGAVTWHPHPGDGVANSADARLGRQLRIAATLTVSDAAGRLSLPAS